MVSDIYVNNGVWNYADRMTKLGHTVFQYCFEYSNPNGFGLLGLTLPFKGATHGTEIPFIFKIFRSFGKFDLLIENRYQRSQVYTTTGIDTTGIVINNGKFFEHNVKFLNMSIKSRTSGAVVCPTGCTDS